MMSYRNTIFDTISTFEPDLWIWLGDAAYTDDFDRLLWHNIVMHQHNLMPFDFVNSRFQMTLEDPGYKKLLQTGLKVVGVWDDHDFGINDADKHNPVKQEMREIYLDFIGEAKNSSRF